MQKFLPIKTDNEHTQFMESPTKSQSLGRVSVAVSLLLPLSSGTVRYPASIHANTQWSHSHSQVSLSGQTPSFNLFTFMVLTEQPQEQKGAHPRLGMHIPSLLPI